MTSTSAAAAHVFISVTRFKQLLHQGVITRQKAGAYDLDTVRKEYLTYIAAIARDITKSGPLDLTRERAKLAQQQTIMVAHKNEVARDEYVRVALLADFLAAEHAAVRARLLSISGSVADRLARKSRVDCETIIRDEICEVLLALSETDSSAEMMNDDGATS